MVHFCDKHYLLLRFCSECMEEALGEYEALERENKQLHFERSQLKREGGAVDSGGCAINVRKWVTYKPGKIASIGTGEKKMIINLTQHPATSDQIQAGVVDLPAEIRQELSALLTFWVAPTDTEMKDRANAIVKLITRARAGKVPVVELYDEAMIGGAPYFMASLEDAVRQAGFTPVYAFSKRESVETVGPDGTVRKTPVFKHAGFVRPQPH